MVPGITWKECIPGTRWNGILAESLFVDNVQIEHRRLPMIELGVINKQLHSFSTTTIIHDAFPPRSPPSPMATTNHDAYHRHCPQQVRHAPKEQERRSNATSPPTARKRASATSHNSATSLTATWQTTNDDVSRRSSSSFQVSTHHHQATR